MSYKIYKVIIDGIGNKTWRLNNQLHREDGPAVERANGTKEWFIDGKLHREDGPAVEYANGTKSWHINGLLHREDGPAVEYADGHCVWFLDDKRISEKEFNRRMSPVKEMTVADIEKFLGHPVKIVKD